MRADRAPRWRDRAWYAPELQPLAIEAMRDAAVALLGEHDFSAFRAAGCTARTTVRRIEAIEVGDLALVESEPVLAIDVRGNAFLRNMVRIVVGTLAEVGAGRRPVAQVSEILASRDRTRAGITAPAHGLELIEVRYDGMRPRGM